jgi:hypothetical protein
VFGAVSGVRGLRPPVSGQAEDQYRTPAVGLEKILRSREQRRQRQRLCMAVGVDCVPGPQLTKPSRNTVRLEPRSAIRREATAHQPLVGPVPCTRCARRGRPRPRGRPGEYRRTRSRRRRARQTPLQCGPLGRSPTDHRATRSRCSATPATTRAIPATSGRLGTCARTTSPITVAVAGNSDRSSAKVGRARRAIAS